MRVTTSLRVSCGAAIREAGLTRPDLRSRPRPTPGRRTRRHTSRRRRPYRRTRRHTSRRRRSYRRTRRQKPYRRTRRHTSRRQRPGRGTGRLTPGRPSPRRIPPHPMYPPTSRHGTSRRGRQPASRHRTSRRGSQLASRRPQPRRRTRPPLSRRASPRWMRPRHTRPATARHGTLRRRTRRRRSCGTAPGYQLARLVSPPSRCGGLAACLSRNGARDGCAEWAASRSR
jgi:hypothetical protein